MKIFSLKKQEFQLETKMLEADVGPLKYIAELIYGEQAKDHFDEAVRWVIIVLIFVFDPLAVLLLIAANISLRTRREGQEEIKNTKKNWPFLFLVRVNFYQVALI